MQQNNLREYELIRDEMINLKDCITTYMGFVLGGSGAAIFGLAALGDSDTNVVGIACASLFLSIVIALVLLVLFYKFNSHNRFAGYSKLLNHERHRNPANEGNNAGNNTLLLAWEVSLERLRHSDTKPEFFDELFESINIEMGEDDKTNLIWIVKKCAGRNPEINKNKFIKGGIILYSGLKGRVETRSWGFPPTVIAVFLVLVMGFLIAGLVATLILMWSDSHQNVSKIGVSVSFSIVLLAQAYFWRTFCGKLYSLVTGSTTVDGFFLRFLPIRAAYLNQYNIKPSYTFAEGYLAELRDEIEFRR